MLGIAIGVERVKVLMLAFIVLGVRESRSTSRSLSRGEAEAAIGSIDAISFHMSEL